MSKPAAPIPVHPWTPIAEPDPTDVYALKALQAGTANEGQQKRVLNLIIVRLAGTYDLPFRPGGLEGARASDFASGKMFVGQQIVRLLNFDVSKLPRQGGPS